MNACGHMKNYAIHTCPHCGNESPHVLDFVRVWQNELGTALEVVYNCPECRGEVVEVYSFDVQESYRLSIEK